jgi:hypothetical protein
VAVEIIKKVIVPRSELPLVQLTTVYNSIEDRNEIQESYYDFRYRIISEDRNRTSAWSPIERIVMPNVTTPFPYTSNQRISISKSGTPEIITAIWTKPSTSENPSEYENIFNKINIYDVWVRWTDTVDATALSVGWTPWTYVTTVSSNTFSIAKPESSYKTVEVAIQFPTEEKLRDYNNNKLTLFKKFGAV